MALFKPFRGSRASLDAQPLHDGYAYFCTDDGSFHIDYTDADGNLQRKQINAQDAETLCGQSLDEIRAEIQVQADWKQTDETAPDYIKNKLGLELGEEPKTVQQPGSEAISEGATAFGSGTFAGLKGFTITAFDDANLTYTLDSALPEEIIAGTEFSTQIRLNYYRQGIITAISDDRLTITVDNYIPKSTAGTNYLWFIDYPNIGTVDLGKYAYAGGLSTKAVQYGATALGYGTEAIGKFGTALGRETEAHYAALAAGYATKALGEEAIALGYQSTANAHRSVVIGQGLEANQANQIIVGKYNAPADDAIFVVGNGTKDAPSNAFTVDFNGQLNTPFEPTNDDNLVNKKYVDKVQTNVDSKLDSFRDRLSNLEEGYITLEGETKNVELPTFIDNTVLINKFGGKSIEGINKANPDNIIDGRNNSKKPYTATSTVIKNTDSLDIAYNYTEGSGTSSATTNIFAFGLWLDVLPNTSYSINLNQKGTISQIYVYSNSLWGTASKVIYNGVETNLIKNTSSESGIFSTTFTTIDQTRILLGFYSSKGRPESETISMPMITIGSTPVSAFEPYQYYSCPITSIVSYDKSGSVLSQYEIPEDIQALPGYGHTDSIVDFNNKIYSYKTTDGISISDIPTVISLDIEQPSLTVEGDGKIEFVNSLEAYIPTSIFYKKPDTTISIIDNLESDDATSALSANMGRELNEKIDNLDYATESYIDTAISNIDIPEQVQTDWNEEDISSKAYILNKPVIKGDEYNNIIEGDNKVDYIANYYYELNDMDSNESLLGTYEDVETWETHEVYAPAFAIHAKLTNSSIDVQVNCNTGTSYITKLRYNDNYIPEAYKSFSYSILDDNSWHTDSRSIGTIIPLSIDDIPDDCKNNWLKAISSAKFSHVGGQNSSVSGVASFAHGLGVKSTADAQAVFGTYNDTKDDALFIIGNGADEDNPSNAFVVNEDGTAQLGEKHILTTESSHESIHLEGGQTAAKGSIEIKTATIEYEDGTSDNIGQIDFDADLVSIKDSAISTQDYVDNKIDNVNNYVAKELSIISDRFNNLDEGYDSYYTFGHTIELPSNSKNDVMLKSIGGQCYPTVNYFDIRNIQNGDVHKGAIFTIDGETINMSYDTSHSQGTFAFAYWLKTEKNTDYTVSLVDTDNSVQSFYLYTDRLWGDLIVEKSYSLASGSNTFNSGNHSNILIGFYAGKSRPSSDTITQVMINKGTVKKTYASYAIGPTIITSLTSYTADGAPIYTYNVPESITTLPYYGYGIDVSSYNIVDFINKTYTIITEDGLTILSEPIVMDISDKIPLTPHLTVEPDGYIKLISKDMNSVSSTLFYQSNVENITYTLTKDENTIYLNGSDGSESSIKAIPVATSETLGGVKEGGDVEISDDGVITIKGNAVTTAEILSQTVTLTDDHRSESITLYTEDNPLGIQPNTEVKATLTYSGYVWSDIELNDLDTGDSDVTILYNDLEQGAYNVNIISIDIYDSEGNQVEPNKDGEVYLQDYSASGVACIYPNNITYADNSFTIPVMQIDGTGIKYSIWIYYDCWDPEEGETIDIQLSPTIVGDKAILEITDDLINQYKTEQINFDYVTATLTSTLSIGSDLNTENSTPYFYNIATANLMPVYGDSIKPMADKSYNLGSSDKRWKEIYATKGIINTSDRNEKNSIITLDNRYSDFFYNLKPVSFKFNSDETEIHIGFVAQDVEEAAKKAGIDVKSLALINVGKTTDGKEIYGLRYEEFIAMNTNEIHKLNSRIDYLERKLEALLAEK